MSKIQIEPLAAESLGVRSMATRIKTPDTSIVIDPGCSLGQRMRLDPHPKEYEALFRANQKLIDGCKKAEILTISHYHYDHLKPSFTDYHFILSNSDLAEILYTDKIILAKDFRENINYSQRQRGYFFNKFTKKLAKKIVWADNQSFEFGNTRIYISKPLPHSELNSKQGFTVSCKVSYEDEEFIHATVQGPIVTETMAYLLSPTPRSIYVGGPPVYLSGFRIPEPTLEMARNNLVELAKNISVLLVDHHLLRTANWREWMNPIYEAANKLNHWVGTSADFIKAPIETLEVFRKELYLNDPPEADFLKWAKKNDEFKKNELPPTLNSPF
jgi:predicted metallo-beta-lactamase superfamily hydrolase